MTDVPPQLLIAHLSRRIDNVELEILSFVLDRLLKSILNSRVVRIDEMRVDELDRQRGFACSEAECQQQGPNEAQKSWLHIGRMPVS